MQSRCPICGSAGVDLVFAFQCSLPRCVNYDGAGDQGKIGNGGGSEKKIEVCGVEIELVKIPPGTFLMGSPEGEPGRYSDEGPQHKVTISHEFWLAKTACTQDLWQAVMGYNPSENKGANLPVESVSWHACQEFCERLNKLFPHLDVRLPTEAEWEYACRAGTNSVFNDGSACTSIEDLEMTMNSLGWFVGNADRKTHPVGLKAPNAWGLHDMHGNVWEWCLDGLRDYTEDAQADPVGPSEHFGRRAFRGGCAWNDARDCRCAFRNVFDPGVRSRSLGFRFIMDGSI